MSHENGPPAPGAVMFPASFAQELLWLLDRAQPGSTAYNVPNARRLVGRLDAGALRCAFDALAERHEILRTTYAFHDERPMQVIHPPRPVVFELVDLGDLPPALQGAEVQRLVRAWSARPFDLARDFPLRVAVARLSAEEHVLHIGMHHVASDGWSREVLFRDLAALYAASVAGEPARLPELPIQYADFAIWQREELAGERLETLLAYWRAELAGAEFKLELPADSSSADEARPESTTRSIVIAPPAYERIKQLGRRFEATPYMTLLAAYAAVLHRYSGQSDVLIGSPSAERAHPETEGLIGHFFNMIVQRARFENDPPFGELLSAVRRSALGAYDHQAVPFEKLVLDVQPEGKLGGTLFQAVLTMLETGEGTGLRLGDVAVLPLGNDLSATKFDLTLFMAERPEGLSLTLRARSGLWKAATIERFLKHLGTLLEAAANDPTERVSHLGLLPPDELAELVAFNAPQSESAPAVTIPELFEAAVRRVPARVAVVSGGREVTYAQLDARAERVGRRLREANLKRGERVGILLERSLESVVALLGIFKAGGSYVPLTLPAARLAQQVAESGLRLVVTTEASAALLPAGIVPLVLEEHDSGAAEAPDDPAFLAGDRGEAYVLFTSGSTGVPKGVAVSHANLANYTRAISRVLTSVGPGARSDGRGELDGLHFGMVSPLGADLGYTALFAALCAGGTLHLLESEVANNPQRFAAYLAERPLDVLKITPNHLRALLPDEEGVPPAEILPRRWLILGGERLPLEFAQRIVDAGACRVLNHYGPTETTVGACTFEATSEALAWAREAGAASVPVGFPLAGVTCAVVDPNGALVPVGISGELALGGAGVANGYVNRAELTATRFVANPVLGRVYLSGDRVRRLAGGALEFLGRTDDQVKVRGYRVELGEVEAALREYEGVAQAAVRAWPDGADTTLVAYVVPTARARAEAGLGDRLGRALATRLPEYMLPAGIELLEALPLTPSGKLDRLALVRPSTAPAARTVLAARSPSEATLVEIWAAAFKREPGTIGVRDDFIGLGGHSLLAIRILGKISREFNVRLPLRTLFDAPTIEQLANTIEAVRASESVAGAEPVSGEPALVRVSRTLYRRPGGTGPAVGSR